MTMPSLPQEIIENILYRVRAKTVGRCRCVSKTWSTFLTQPHFIKTHLKHIHSSFLLVVSDSETVFSVTLNNVNCWAKKLDFPVKPLGLHGINKSSCDGLVLVQDDVWDQWSLWLINPTTRAIRAVPPSPYAKALTGNNAYFGFGCDEVGNDYKVVCLSYFYFEDGRSAETIFSIFSVKTGAWRRLESSPYDHIYGLGSSGVFVDGYVHWCASKTRDYTSTKCIITAISLRDEKFYEVPLPSYFDDNDDVLFLLEILGGLLCMFVLASGEVCEFWVMKEYGVKESWTKLITTEMLLFAQGDNTPGMDYMPLCLLGEERVLVTGRGNKLMAYDRKEGTMKEIVVSGSNGIPGDFCNGVIYVESLVSLDWCHA